MTKIAITTAMIVVTSLAIYGQDKKLSGFAEIQITTTKAGTTPQLNVSLEQPITKKFGVFFYGLTSKGYSEAYAGLTYSPKPWIQVAGGMGAESQRKFRLGGYVWTGKGRFSNFLVLEGKGSGFWYKNTATVAVTKTAKVGARIQRFKGAGPYAEYDIPHTPLKVWGAVLFQNNQTAAQFGLRYKF